MVQHDVDPFFLYQMGWKKPKIILRYFATRYLSFLLSLYFGVYQNSSEGFVGSVPNNGGKKREWGGGGYMMSEQDQRDC